MAAAADHGAEALVLTCMDFRLVAPMAAYLEGRGLKGQYDHVALAGAAIGVMSDQVVPWGQAFWDHLGLAQSLHGINRVIVIDHRDCGAARKLVDPTCGDDRDAETAIHTDWMQRLSAEITRRAPGLAVELVLMDLDGSVDEIAAA